MAKFADRVKVGNTTAASAGSATTLTLGSAEAGYQAVPSSLDGETIRYVIEEGNTWEIGTGTYTHSGTTLTRSVTSSSNSNNAIAVTTNSKVFIAPVVDDLQFVQVYSSTSDLPSASSNHGRITHVHGEGAMYFAHGGSWIKLANASDAISLTDLSVTQNAASGSGALTYNSSTGVFSYTPPTLTSASGGTLEPVKETEFTATANQTTFTVTYAVGNIAVFLNGSKLGAADFTATNGTSVVLATGATANDLVEVVEYGAPFASPYSSSIHTATANQTSLTVAYTVGKVAVYVNGVKYLVGTDVTATNGTSLTFTSALSAGDKIEVVEHGALADAASTFTDLTDTPSSLGTAGQVVQVNSAGNALEFATASSGVSTIGSLDFSPSGLNETSTITTSSNMSNAPFISAFKEEPSSTGIITKGNWDVSSGASNYDLPSESSSSNYSGVTLTPSSATANGTFTMSGLDTAITDISNITYDSKTIAAGDSSPFGIRFNPTGTKMFIAGAGTDDIGEFDLTAWNVSTASSVRNFSLSGQSLTYPTDISFNSDGTKLFVLEGTTSVIYQYDLGSTPYSLENASYDNVSIDLDTVKGANTYAESIFFKPDGSKLIVLNDSSDHVYSFSLTNWGLSTLSYDGSSADLYISSINGQAAQTSHITFTSDGKVMLVSDLSNDKISLFTLSSAYAPSTASYQNQLLIRNTVDTPRGLVLGDSQNKLYVLGDTGNAVYQYSTNGSAGALQTADMGKTLKANGGEVKLQTTDGKYELVTAFNDTSAITSFTLDTISSSDAGLTLSKTTIPNSLADISYNNNNKTSTTDSSPRGIWFKPDGKSMYVCGDGSNYIRQHNLTEAWNLTTASHNSSDYFSISSQVSSCRDIVFNSEGTIFIVLDESQRRFYKYTIPEASAWDITQASYSNQSSDQVSLSPKSFWTDGTNILWTNWDSTGRVYSATMTTAWDVSSSSLTLPSTSSYYTPKREDNTTNMPVSYCEGIYLYDDGKKMLLTFSESNSTYKHLHEYDLSPAYAATSATHTGTSHYLTEASTDYYTNAKYFDGGRKLFVTAKSNDEIYGYDTVTHKLPTAGAYTIATTNDNGQIRTDAWNDINSLVSDETLNDGSTYYAFSTDGRTTWKVQDSSGNLRSIARENSSTWQYNSNTTFGSETWTAASSNTQRQALVQALGVSVNQMTGTALSAISDANLLATSDRFDLMIGLYAASASNTPPVSDAITINYDKNAQDKGAILGTDYDVERLSNTQLKFTALTQKNMHFKVI